MGVWVLQISSPRGVWGGAHATIDFWCILALTSHIWWQQFLYDFSDNQLPKDPNCLK